jgi:hypothetical protein
MCPVVADKPESIPAYGFTSKKLAAVPDQIIA